MGQAWNGGGFSIVGVGTEDFTDNVVIVGVVGSYLHSAAGYKTTVEGREELWGEEATAVVAAFRPGVGEVDIDCGDRVERYQVFKGIEGFEADDTDIVEVVKFELTVYFADTIEETFDGYIADIGVSRSTRQQKASITGTEVDLNRCSWREDSGEVDGRGDRFTGQLEFKRWTPQLEGCGVGVCSVIEHSAGSGYLSGTETEWEWCRPLAGGTDIDRLSGIGGVFKGEHDIEYVHG